MRSASWFVELLRQLLIFAVALVLLPLRLLSMLTGGVLLLVGMLGVPLWLIQLVISLAGGGNGDGPLAVWEMCLLLALAIPLGVVLLRFADVPEPVLPTVGHENPPTGLGGDILVEYMDRPAVSAFEGNARSIRPIGVVGQSVGEIIAAYRQLARHERRMRVANARTGSLRDRRRGSH